LADDVASRCYVFDAYGTLFDVHSAVDRHAREIGADARRLSEVWRAKQLEYTWIYARLERKHTFAEVTERGLDYAIAYACRDPVSPEMRQRLLASYRSLALYPEVWRALASLKVRGARLAILSNGDPGMLTDVVEHGGLEDLFEAVLSVEAAGLFKPAPAVYALATRALGVMPREVTFLSANRWDIAGAKAFGFRSVWVNRGRLPNEYPELAPDVILPDLSSLAAE
jgi:2-haloacid dehalogenase